jgi:hypothetical protein
MTARKPILAAVALAMSLAIGCEDTDDSSTSTRRDRDGDGIADRYDRYPNSDDRRDGDVILSRERYDRDRDLDGDLDRTSRTRPGLSEIPRDATQVREGEGRTIRYEATRDGRVYVYDEDDDRVVYSGKLFRGENFVADPDRDVLSVNGKRLDDINLRSAHRYRIYFDPS